MLGMIATIQMNNSSVTNIMSIMADGYEMTFGNQNIQFKFQKPNRSVQMAGSEIILFVEDYKLDVSAFPESSVLENEEFLRAVTSINEFFARKEKEEESSYIGGSLLAVVFDLDGTIIPVRQEIIDAYNNTMLNADFFLYDMDEYAKDLPMTFICLPEPLTDTQKVHILEAVDEMYSETGEQTSRWALEYQLWARMLLLQNSLPVFVRHLELHQEDISKICSILGGPHNSLNAKLYIEYANNAELCALVQREYKENPDIQEGFSVNAANWPTLALS